MTLGGGPSIHPASNEPPGVAEIPSEVAAVPALTSAAGALQRPEPERAARSVANTRTDDPTSPDRTLAAAPVAVTTSRTGFTCGPSHTPAGKNTAVYLPAGSGGITSRLPDLPSRHNGVQYLERRGG